MIEASQSCNCTIHCNTVLQVHKEPPQSTVSPAPLSNETYENKSRYKRTLADVLFWNFKSPIGDFGEKLRGTVRTEMITI